MKNVTGFLTKTSLKIIRVYCIFDHSRVNIVDSEVDKNCLCLEFVIYIREIKIIFGNLI